MRVDGQENHCRDPAVNRERQPLDQFFIRRHFIFAGGQAPVKPERKPVEHVRAEQYYDVKTTCFNALIDTIDLTQLARLEVGAAREEIRDIVSEIIQIKNVVMSIAEQEELLEDICNDVLGYGPLEPLLARDDIADIMVNGADTTYIEVGGKEAEHRAASSAGGRLEGRSGVGHVPSTTEVRTSREGPGRAVTGP